MNCAQPFPEAGTITVQDDGDTLQEWQFEVIPDAPPRIEVVGDIETGPDQSIRFTYKASDDYGVSRPTRIRPVG